MLHPEIVPLILAHDDDDYHTQLTAVENLVTRVQVDIMDGEFVPQATIGAPTIEGYATELRRDVHLMVANPLSHLAEYSRLGVDHLIFQAEAVEGVLELQTTAQEIRNLGNRVGLAFNLETSLAVLEEMASLLDLVQLLSVTTGVVGAQNFEKEILPRILSVRERYPKMPIAVSGGVSLSNVKEIKEAGANMFVVGSHLFQSGNIHGYLEQMRNEIR